MEDYINVNKYIQLYNLSEQYELGEYNEEYFFDGMENSEKKMLTVNKKYTQEK